MRRRDIARTLLVSTAGSMLIAERSRAGGGTSARYERTSAEIGAGVTPTNHEYLPYDWPRYGADPTGVVNSRDAIQNALTAAGHETTAASCDVTPGKYRCDAGLTWDTNKVGVALNGSTIDFSRMTSGHAIQFTNSARSVNVRPLLNAVHSLKDGYLTGPGVNVTGVDCLYINDSGSNSEPGVKIRDVSFQDFATDATFANGVSFTVFDSCMFTLLSGVATTYSVIQAAGNNTGERNSFINCTWFNKQFLISNLATLAADINCIACSFDYFSRAFSITGGAGSVTVIGGHMEANSDADNWGFVQGSISALILSAVTFAVTGNRSTHDLFWSDSTVTNGGIFIRDCFLGTGRVTFDKHLIGGGGNARVDNLIQSGFGAHPVIAASLNCLAYGGFENAHYVAEWILGGSNPAVRSSERARTGAWSLSLPGSAGNQPFASSSVACRPGQYFQGEYWYACPTIAGTSGTFLGKIEFLDRGGNSLGTTQITVAKANVTAWTRAGFRSFAPAPAGTVIAQLTFVVFGIASGDATCYVDDVIANVA
jgi:hypothetical protein